MKTWFAKFRISSALDTGRPVPESVRRSVASSEELHRFEGSLANLDQALRGARPESPIPARLHNSIMNAVRAAEPSATARRPALAFRWLAASSVAAAVVIAACWIGLRPSPPPVRPPSLAMASTAVAVSSQAPQAVPEAMIAPLSDELARIESDCDGGFQTVLASLP
jgi:hypothetical protein